MRHVRLRSFRLLALATALAGLYAAPASAQYDRDWQRACIGSTYAINPDTPCNLSLIHISEPTRLLSISYAVFCLKKKNS